MIMVAAAVHKVRFEVHGPQFKHFWRRVGRRHYDPGYVGKGFLAAAFGTGAGESTLLRPFCVLPPKGQMVRFEGYSQYSAAQLKERAHQIGDSEAISAIDWDSFSGFQLAKLWPARMGFTVSVVPKARTGCLDYYKYCQQYDPSLSREQAYAQWLKNAFDKKSDHLPDGSGAQLVETSLLRWYSQVVCRANEPNLEGIRKEQETVLVVTELTGTIDILDSGLFTNFLLVGLGRNRAFGYGMLRLHAPSSARALSSPSAYFDPPRASDG